MLKKLVRTDNDVGGLIARLTLGLVIFPHGAQKMLGWFGGYGFTGTMGFLTEGVGLLWIVAFLVICAEFFGSLMLIAGVFTRFGAFSIGCVMLGAMLMIHLPNGFFMNWSGMQQGEGYEFHLLAIGLAILLMVKGGGRASVDQNVLMKKLK